MAEIEMTKEEFYTEGERLFGPDRKGWEFRCPGCGKVQTMAGLLKRAKKGEISGRYGDMSKLKGKKINPELVCYGEHCDWCANGLFCSGKLVIYDPSKPHNENLKENCVFVFPFSKKEPEEGI